MPFKELAFVADIKREVFRTQRHTVTASNVKVIFTKVRAYLLCSKNF